MASQAWSQFERDPRSPQAARLRASDRDRDVAFATLGDAFAEGRLDHQEYDERLTAVTNVKLLSEVVPLLEDLIPDAPTSSLPVRPTSGPTAGLLSTDDIHQRAVRKWESDRRDAALSFVGLSTLLWVIWGVTMLGGFPWPLFPMAFALMNLLRTVARKRDIIETHERRLLKRRHKALSVQQRPTHGDGHELRSGD